MNKSFFELSKSLSPFTKVFTISAYEPEIDLDTRNLSFRTDSIEVKNKAIACTFCEVFTERFSYT